MPSAPLPENEVSRLQSLRNLQVLDTEPEEQFDALVKVASLACGVPISLISLVDAERQWFKANRGLPGLRETPRDLAFCSHAILGEAIFEVCDATLDPRFSDNPLVTDLPNIRFYAGAPVRLSSGECVGTLCVIDQQPRQLDAQQRDILTQLALVAARALESRRALASERRLLEEQAHVAALLRDSEARFRALSDASPLGVFSADTHGNCTYSNARWQSIFGLTGAQSLGAQWMDAICPDDRAGVQEALRRSAASGAEFDQEFRLLQTGGVLRHVHSRACVVVGPDNAVHSMVGVLQDITERKTQDLALRESRALLDRTGRMAGVGGWTIDLVSKAVTWSDETCRILGVEPGYQPTLEEAFDFYPPEARPVIQAAVDKCMATGQDWDHELPLIQVGGRRIWTRSVGAIDASDGVPVRLVGAFQDVTESRAQRLAVVEARERIELATGSGEIGIWDCNLVSGVLTWDAKMCQFYGINPSEQTSYDLWVQHLHPEDRVGTERAMEDALAGLRPFDTEFRVIRGDGSVRHLRATARIKRDDQGCAVRLVGVNWDVSTLRELALELERKEQMLHSVTDSLPMLVNYIDLQQRYRFANHTYVAWYGMPVEDIIGRRVADFLNPSTWARVEPHLQAALQGTPSVHENQLFALGQQRDLRAQFMPQWNERGQVEGVVSVITDISEYKATEQRLAQAVERATEQLHQTNAALVQRNLDLQQFAFVASHDLRTPLRSVKGLLTLLQARHASSLDAKGNDIITRATKAIGQMDELTEDLLSYARLDAPAQAFEPVDCNAVLADTLNFLDASLAQTGAQVTVEALPTLMGERGQLVQLFQNLLGNALKYCQGRTPLVQVSARRGTAEWVFQVADNGIGIAPQHLARIFEVFKRLHTAKEYSGNGIGLAICERIVVRHGGRIWVQSEPGQGSTFFFSIPDKVQTS